MTPTGTGELVAVMRREKRSSLLVGPEGAHTCAVGGLGADGEGLSLPLSTETGPCSQGLSSLLVSMLLPCLQAHLPACGPRLLACRSLNQGWHLPFVPRRAEELGWSVP